MFNLGAGEVLVILLVALIVLGPQKLPEAARKVGQVMGELRRVSGGFQAEIRSALDDAERIERLDTPTAKLSPGTSPEQAAAEGMAGGEQPADDEPSSNGDSARTRPATVRDRPLRAKRRKPA